MKFLKIRTIPDKDFEGKPPERMINADHIVDILGYRNNTTRIFLRGGESVAAFNSFEEIETALRDNSIVF